MDSIERMYYFTACIIWYLVWIAGIVLSKGFVSTFFAVITGGLWSSYVVIEYTIQKFIY